MHQHQDNSALHLRPAHSLGISRAAGTGRKAALEVTEDRPEDREPTGKDHRREAMVVYKMGTQDLEARHSNIKVVMVGKAMAVRLQGSSMVDRRLFSRVMGARDRDGNNVILGAGLGGLK